MSFPDAKSLPVIKPATIVAHAYATYTLEKVNKVKRSNSKLKTNNTHSQAEATSFNPLYLGLLIPLLLLLLAREKRKERQQEPVPETEVNTETFPALKFNVMIIAYDIPELATWLPFSINLKLDQLNHNAQLMLMKNNRFARGIRKQNKSRYHYRPNIETKLTIAPHLHGNQFLM
jgi:hypothetical protein